MNGIDVSSWQRGIDITKVPCDFVIVKATQGIDYVNPDCDRVVQQAIIMEKSWGFYHYIDGSGVKNEVNFFIQNTKNYFTHGIPCVDWERQNNKKYGDLVYLDSVVKEIKRITGIPPIIYASYSGYPWEVAARNNCGTWVAQYRDMNRSKYEEQPWNEYAYACVIRQYSSNGRLPNFNGALDLNKAYITKEQWQKYANPVGKPTAEPKPKPNPNTIVKPTFNDMVTLTILGKYGNGVQRKALLGDNYNRVQARVNELIQLARKTQRGDYGNGDTRRVRLGANYDIIQYIINNKLS